jgi:hypothetical protein
MENVGDGEEKKRRRKKVEKKKGRDWVTTLF